MINANIFLRSADFCFSNRGENEGGDGSSVSRAGGAALAGMCQGAAVDTVCPKPRTADSDNACQLLDSLDSAAEFVSQACRWGRQSCANNR